MISPLIPRPAQVEFVGSGTWDGVGPVDEATRELGQGGPESYRVTIAKGGATLAASSAAGLFYARRTLAQLRFHHTVAGQTGIPFQTLTDQPRWGHRGLLLDVCRHWFPVAEVKRLLDLMADLKLNVFHWHLTDDQGWRLPVKGWPRLTAEQPAYTEDEIRDVVAFASARHITVVPEVDLPGHFSAALAAYPELGCRKTPVSRPTGPGIYFDIACAGSEATVRFLEAVLTSVCELFPGPVVHLGGDEAPKLRWRDCSACQARLRERGLHDEEELQGWLTNHLAAFLKTRGKTAQVWTESVYSGTLDRSVLVQHWAEMPDKGRASAWANSGGKTIVSQMKHHYLDYPCEMTPLAVCYEEPTWLGTLNDQGLAGVKGLEAALWTEFVADRATLDARLFPRLAALAERAWSPGEVNDLTAFLRRYEGWAAWFSSLGATVLPLTEANPDPRAFGSRLRTFGHFLRLFVRPSVLGGLLAMVLTSNRPKKGTPKNET